MKTKCPKCGGLKWITWPGPNGVGGPVTCPRCEGTGTDPEKVKVQP